MKRFLASLGAVAVMTVSSLALADVANDPCEGLEEGAACTTLDDEAYVDLFGEPGGYREELKVYGRLGQPCRRCRTPIESVKISQRSSYYCPQCKS